MSGPTPFKTLHTQAAEIASQEGFTDKRPVSHEGPLPLVRDIPDPDPYPVEALGPLRAAAEAAQDLTQAPIEIAAQSVLASASLGTQVIADVQTLGGTAPVSLYVLTIARSGERKSSVDKILTKSIRDWERTQWARYEDEVEKWKNDHAIWKADHELAMKVFKTGKGDRTAATADLDALGPEPKPPVEPAVIVSDPTVEGIQKLLAKGKMSLGMFSDEGGQFLGGFGMSKDNRLKTISTLSSLWDGTPITRTRAGDGTKTLFGRRITMHLMVQPKVAQGLLGDGLSNDQGFLARMLISYPKSAIGTRIKESCAPGNDGKLSTFGERLDQLLDAGAAAEVAPSRDENKRVLKLSTNALTLLREFHLAVETAQKSGGKLETVTAFASKAAEQAARIAAVLTLWEDENAQEISAEAMANGVALADYYLSEAKRVVDAGQISENTRIAEKIRVWLLEKWPDLARANGRSSDAFLSSDILRLGPNELRDKGKLKVPLAKLQECGWIIRLPASTEIDGKRRKEAYRIVRA